MTDMSQAFNSVQPSAPFVDHAAGLVAIQQRVVQEQVEAGDALLREAAQLLGLDFHGLRVLAQAISKYPKVPWQ